MRRSTALASLVALAASAVGVQAAASPSDAYAAPAASHAARVRPAVVTAALQALGAHPGAAHASPGQAFTSARVVRDRTGSHVRLDRTYRGLPVLGGDLVVHRGPHGGWRGVSQTLRAPLRMTVTPTVSAASAADHLLGAARLLGAPRLVVDATRATPRLAWEVVSVGRQADRTPSRLATFVDARSGAVIRREQQVETVDGQGQTLYSGTVPLQLTKSGTTYQLKDATRGGTYTTDVNNAVDGPLCSALGFGCKNGTQVTSATTTFGNGTTTNRASASADAQYGTNVTWDYYKLVHGRNGIFGTGAGSFNRVHYDKNYVNAFWDGTKMTYGDGDGVNFGPLVSLDVTGHEMSHGVTENTAGLTYSGESGGLNESTSDIFGTMVEFYAANAADPGDYLIGEEFDLKNHAGFRRMDNPIADGSSPNCYSTGTKNLDVHYSSGVGNHFFYLLAEGSGAKTINGIAHNSPTCNGSAVAGIGRDAAQKIWFRALTVYMTSGTTYAQARTATLSAAQDLYGAGSTQRATVAAAWSAVGVA